jgi:hypothetical protein
MPQDHGSLIAAVAALEAASTPIIEVEGMLLLRTKQALRPWAHESGEIDRVGAEATLNKRYVVDLLDLTNVRCDEVREELTQCGMKLIEIWASRISLEFPSKVVVFYLGGSEDVILRFHVRRDGVRDWTDLNDRQFLLSSHLQVYELRSGKLRLIAPVPAITHS